MERGLVPPPQQPVSKGIAINHFLDHLSHEYRGKEYVLLPAHLSELEVGIEPFGWAAERYITDEGGKSPDPRETPKQGDKLIVAARNLGFSPKEIEIAAIATNDRLRFGRPPSCTASTRFLLPVRNGPPSPNERVWELSVQPGDERTEIVKVELATFELGVNEGSRGHSFLTFRFPAEG